MARSLLVQLGRYENDGTVTIINNSGYFKQSLDRIAVVITMKEFKYPVTIKFEANGETQYRTVASESVNLGIETLYTGFIKNSGVANIKVTVTDKDKFMLPYSDSRNVLPYSRPAFTKLTVQRCDSNSNVNQEGNYALVTFGGLVSSLNNTNKFTYKLQYKKSSDTSYTTHTFTNIAANVYELAEASYKFAADTESSYDIVMTVTDSYYSSTKSTSVSTAFTLMHFGADGKSIGFGKIAEETNMVDIGMNTKFNGNVTGNVMGLGKLTTIPANSNFNSYTKTGSYAVHANADAETITNIPVKIAGRLEVANAVGSGVVSTGWASLRQKFIPYLVTLPTFERQVVQTSATDWTFGEWKTTSLNGQKLIWSNPTTNNGWYMGANDVIEFPNEPVSNQPNGIVLVFCAASGNTSNYHVQTYFVPKQVVKSMEGAGHNIPLSTSDFAHIGSKYIYVGAASITGNDVNIGSGTKNGVTYNNTHWVLKYIIGV